MADIMKSQQVEIERLKMKQANAELQLKDRDAQIAQMQAQIEQLNDDLRIQRGRNGAMRAALEAQGEAVPKAPGE